MSRLICGALKDFFLYARLGYGIIGEGQQSGARRSVSQENSGRHHLSGVLIVPPDGTLDIAYKKRGLAGGTSGPLQFAIPKEFIGNTCILFFS